ncbi:MAG: hypothetical protein ACJAT1_002264 [Marivirga sp.]|jgi:hypothetical protein
MSGAAVKIIQMNIGIYLRLRNLVLEDKFATFYWTWDTGPTDYPHNYKVSAKKINNKWKLTSLNGFRYYQSNEYYDNIMNSNGGG